MTYSKQHNLFITSTIYAHLYSKPTFCKICSSRSTQNIPLGGPSLSLFISSSKNFILSLRVIFFGFSAGLSSTCYENENHISDNIPHKIISVIGIKQVMVGGCHFQLSKMCCTVPNTALLITLKDTAGGGWLKGLKQVHGL